MARQLLRQLGLTEDDFLKQGGGCFWLLIVLIIIIIQNSRRRAGVTSRSGAVGGSPLYCYGSPAAWPIRSLAAILAACASIGADVGGTVVATGTTPEGPKVPPLAFLC